MVTVTVTMTVTVTVTVTMTVKMTVTVTVTVTMMVTVMVTVTVMLTPMLMVMASQERVVHYSSREMKEVMALAHDTLVKTLGAVIKMDLEAEVEEVLTTR